MVEFFDPTTLYDDGDIELELIGTKERRAQWRHRRVGPKYIKMGKRVKYSGAALNDWIEKNTIQTDEVA
ncbi:MAG: MerR family transcriptional regulator [Verrucomicrobia bacterium]|jgi:hypothetical protein|nr:MerR family transcriptional regulator [Verrucomicrobiota bacterium]